MDRDPSASTKVNIDKELLAILCCPESKQDVSLIDEKALRILNKKIEEGELKNKAGALVKEKLDGGLVRADKKIVYPIREDIPVMLIEEGIPVEGFLQMEKKAEFSDDKTAPD